MKIDLNCDLGESFGNYKIVSDGEMIKLASSINIACGWHAGDPNVMDRTVKMALENQVAIGCHPGFPDLMGFGRRYMSITPMEMKNYVKYQIGALDGFVRSKGGKMKHVKPHGAMYNMAAKDKSLADAIAEAIYEIDGNLKLYGLSGSQLITSGNDIGLTTVNEVFSDRRYQDDATLLPRDNADAVIHDGEQMVRQVAQMINDGSVRTVSGKVIPILAESICIHGDNSESINFAKSIHRYFKETGIEIASPNKNL